jgi:uncharacterized protein YodC (DUF2158 family)
MPLGTRVRLASGGPVMLVVDIHPETMSVTCAWHGGEAVFPVVCLDVIRRHHVI